MSLLLLSLHRRVSPRTWRSVYYLSTRYPASRIICGPDDIRTITTAPPTTLHPGAGGDVLAPLVGQRSFMLLEEDKHLHARRTISPAFHHTSVTVFADACRHHRERGGLVAAGDGATAYSSNMRLILRVIPHVIFGLDALSLDRLYEDLMAMLVVSAPKTTSHTCLARCVAEISRARAEVDHLLHGLVDGRRWTRDDHGQVGMGLPASCAQLVRARQTGQGDRRRWRREVPNRHRPIEIGVRIYHPPAHSRAVISASKCFCLVRSR
jgi:cytochrome P450